MFFRAIPDLGGIALFGLVAAFIVGGKAFVDAIASVLNVGIAGVHPFAGAAVALERTVGAWLERQLANTEKIMAGFWNDLAGSLQLMLGIAILLGDSVVKGVGYLWNTALPAFVKLQTDAIGTVAHKAETLAGALVGSIASNLSAAKNFAESQSDRALSSAQAFTEAKIADAIGAIRSEISADVQTLRDGYSDAVTSALSTAQAGISAAERLAASQVLEAEQIAAAGVAEAERLAGSALAQSEAAARQALAEAEARGKAALDEVGKIAGSLGSDLKTIEGALGAAGVAGLIAAIPAIATLVHAIATEAGLDSANCRAKHKQICGTDSHAWAGLLGSIAAAGLLFDFKQIVHASALLARPVVALVKQAE